jgi:hypothetical protein
VSEKTRTPGKPEPDDDEIDRSDTADAEAEYERTVEPPDLDDEELVDEP